jgi:hypothetical protein
MVTLVGRNSLIASNGNKYVKGVNYADDAVKGLKEPEKKLFAKVDKTVEPEKTEDKK